MKKKLILCIVAIALILTTVGTLLTVSLVKSRKAPDLESLRPRIIELIEASREINKILFGEGLPTYPRVYQTGYTRNPFYLEKNGSAYQITETPGSLRLYYYTFTDAEIGTVIAYQYCLSEKQDDGTYLYYDIETGSALTASDRGKYRYARESTEPGAENLLYQAAGRYFYKLPEYQEKKEEFYYSSSDDPYYDYVRFDCGYLTVASIKEKAASVYASGYLSSVGESLFTGITVSDRDNGTLSARYIEYTDSEGNVYLMKSNTWKALSTDRIFLFDTMKMVKPSNSRYVNIEIETYLSGEEENRTTVRISLAYQNGNWYLDSPSF